MDPIISFRGEHAFLSNFYTSPFEWRGIEFNSGEQAFTYAKGFFHLGNGPEQQAYFDAVVSAPTPGWAKKLGRVVPIDVKAWDQSKIDYMRNIVHAKFKDDYLAGMLIGTGAAMLVEGNTWGDTYWGRCLDPATDQMVGYNMLGVILMEERGYQLYK